MGGAASTEYRLTPADWDPRGSRGAHRVLWFVAISVIGLVTLTAGPFHLRRAATAPTPDSTPQSGGITIADRPRTPGAADTPVRVGPGHPSGDTADSPPGHPTSDSPSTTSPALPAAAIEVLPNSGAVGVPDPARAPRTLPAGTTRPLRLAVVGDSVGLTMQLNLPSRLRRRFRLVDGTIEGCGVFDFGRVVSSSGLGHDMARCRNFPSRWANRAAAGDVDAALVVIGAWETFDLDIGDRRVVFGSPEFDLLFGSGLRRGIAALLDRGIDVILLRVPCYGPPPGSILPERAINGRSAHLNQLLEAAVAENPGRVSIVDPVPEFCRDRELTTDTTLRWDGVHMGPAGGELIWDRLSELLPTVTSRPS